MTSMTTLIKRANHLSAGGDSSDSTDHVKRKEVKNRPLSLNGGVLLALLIFAAFTMFRDPDSEPLGASSFDICPGVKLYLNFDKLDISEVITLGTHHVTFTVKNRPEDLRLWMRVTGPSLIGVYLEESKTGHWKGNFSLPMEGNYKVVVYATGCDGSSIPVQANMPIEFLAQGQQRKVASMVPRRFPDSVWIARKEFDTLNKTISQPYIWIDQEISPRTSSLTSISNSVLAFDGTLGENKTYSFGQLSNYEIVCWIGSESAEKLHSAFLELRPIISQGQRPFKFHYHKIQNFVNPARDWEEENKKRFRKCKHVLISLDEMETKVSQEEYRQQVFRFIRHLLKAFPDETFPIWMFTVIESPISADNCHSPFLKRTSGHHCNEVLKELFQTASFPDRVQLLDNTDLSFPQLGDNKEDIVAVVALRIFVLVGKRVQEWRAAGQTGTSKGLKKGDELVPNFDLVPYTDWDTN